MLNEEKLKEMIKNFRYNVNQPMPALFKDFVFGAMKDCRVEIPSKSRRKKWIGMRG